MLLYVHEDHTIWNREPRTATSTFTVPELRSKHFCDLKIVCHHTQPSTVALKAVGGGGGGGECPQGMAVWVGGSLFYSFDSGMHAPAP